MSGLFEDSTLATAAHILTAGPVSRADAARGLGFSAGTLTRLVRPMIDSGFVLDERTGTSRSGMGRPTQLLEIPASKHVFIGINLTATAIHAALVDARARVCQSRKRIITDTDPMLVAASISSLIRSLTDGISVEGINISLGGVIADRSVVESRFLGWVDVPLVTLIDVPSGVPVELVNDLEALTVLEQWFGLGTECEDFILVTVGAGIGHGMVHSRRLVTSPAGGHGMTSHFPIVGAAGICEYGHIGCANGALTTPAVVGRARAGRSVASRDGAPESVADLLRLADNGDAACRSTINEFAACLSTYVQEVASAALVRDVVLDGEGVALLGSPWAGGFTTQLDKYWNPKVPPLRVHRRSGSFDRWAQGAAVTAIAAWLERSIDTLD